MAVTKISCDDMSQHSFSHLTIMIVKENKEMLEEILSILPVTLHISSNAFNLLYSTGESILLTKVVIQLSFRPARDGEKSYDALISMVVHLPTFFLIL